VPIQSPNVPPGPPVRFIGAVFGFVFGGIGLTILGFLWTPSEFTRECPVFFQIIGSLMAVGFVAFGGTMFFSAISGRMMGASPGTPAISNAIRPPMASPTSHVPGYVCSNCGAPLTEQADVSPLGDVKCPFCHTWFNIHQPAS
jgi:hypothetical protein